MIFSRKHNSNEIKTVKFLSCTDESVSPQFNKTLILTTFLPCFSQCSLSLIKGDFLTVSVLRWGFLNLDWLSIHYVEENDLNDSSPFIFQVLGFRVLAMMVCLS